MPPIGYYFWGTNLLIFQCIKDGEFKSADSFVFMTAKNRSKIAQVAFFFLRKSVQRYAEEEKNEHKKEIARQILSTSQLFVL